MVVWELSGNDNDLSCTLFILWLMTKFSVTHLHGKRKGFLGTTQISKSSC